MSDDEFEMQALANEGLLRSTIPSRRTILSGMKLSALLKLKLARTA
jgi:hypothetical protein